MDKNIPGKNAKGDEGGERVKGDKGKDIRQRARRG